MLVWLMLGAVSPALADPIQPTPTPISGAEAQSNGESRTRSGRDVRPLDDGNWSTLDPRSGERSRRAPPARKKSSDATLLVPLLALGGAILVVAFVVALSMRRSAASEAARYLERTRAPFEASHSLERNEAPWGRREDLFVEKLILELRLHHAEELTQSLALQQRFEELDKAERPLRKMRSRFRSVRREYEHIATRIGPVTKTVRNKCAQSIRRCGLVRAPALSGQEREALQRLSLAIEREKRAM